MKILRIGLGLLVIQGLLFNNSLMAATAKVTLKVVDDEGKPVPAFPVKAGFYAGEKFQGTTDSNGLFVMDGKAPHWEVNWVLQKDGYYRSQVQYEFKGGIKDDKWQPWNPIVMAVVRPVINPIPMYVKRVEARILRTNEWFSYDLMAGDWVKPIGEGAVNDLCFRITGTWKGVSDFNESLELRFSCAKDGIIPVRYNVASERPTGSTLFMPREAPSDGYIASREWQQAKGEGITKEMAGESESGSLGKGYLFRVRSQTNEAGRVVCAVYGKMPIDVVFIGDGGKPGFLYFTYYLNPTPNDRNLEFDPKRNLFHNLKSNEQVTWP